MKLLEYILFAPGTAQGSQLYKTENLNQSSSRHIEELDTSKPYFMRILINSYSLGESHINVKSIKYMDEEKCRLKLLLEGCPQKGSSL